MREPAAPISKNEPMKNEPLKRWKVLPHGKLSEVDENILTVTGELHVPMELPRRMTVVRLRDTRPVVFSAISQDAAGMRVQRPVAISHRHVPIEPGCSSPYGAWCGTAASAIIPQPDRLRTI